MIRNTLLHVFSSKSLVVDSWGRDILDSVTEAIHPIQVDTHPSVTEMYSLINEYEKRNRILLFTQCSLPL